MNNAARLARALVLAAACCLVLATRVLVGFEPVRVKLAAPVTAVAGVARVTDARFDALQPPFAVIARVHHGSAAGQSFSVRLDGQTVCQRVVAGPGARRIDCAMAQAWERRSGHEVVVQGPPTAWTLDYLELATHHGHTTGVVNVFILPATFTRYHGPQLPWILASGLVLTGLLLLPRPAPSSRATTLVYRLLPVPVVALFGLALAAPIVSPYRLVVSPWTFIGWIALSVLPRLWWAGRRLTEQLAAAAPDRWHAQLRSWRSRVRESIPRLAHGWALPCVLAIALSAVGFTWGTRALGGADTYAYVSEAELWLRGTLTVDQSFAKEAPWPHSAWSFSPLGYMPHPVDDRVIVPTYSAGLPMLLAVAKVLGGQNAMFCIVPLCGGLLVLATYGIGRRLGSGTVGVIGAWLVATSPVVLAHVMVTMTDVPVAAAWAATFYLLLGTEAGNAAGAGLLASTAILIRPNLAPLAAVLALHYLFRMRHPESRRRAVTHLILFGMAALPGVLAVAAINQHWYGSPLVSGYGRAVDLYDSSRGPANLRNYLRWLVEAHTIAVLAGLAAIFVPLRRLWPKAGERHVFVVIAAFVSSVWALYCLWLVFDSWWFTRFLLPSWPFIMLGVGAVAVALGRMAGWPVRVVIAGSLLAIGIVQFRFAVDHKVFYLGLSENRNVVVAQLTRQMTEPNSVVISLTHSGAIRYYGERITLHFGRLDADWLDRAVNWLRDRGVHTYAVLEDWEMPEFRRRFAGSPLLVGLERRVTGMLDQPGRAMIFDLTAPARESPSTPVVVTGVKSGWSAVPPTPSPSLVFGPVP